METKAGKGLKRGGVTFDTATPRPINVPAMQAAFLTITGQLTFPLTTKLEEGGNKTLLAYAERFLTTPRTFKVEIKGLNGQRFESVVAVEAGS